MQLFENCFKERKTTAFSVNDVCLVTKLLVTTNRQEMFLEENVSVVVAAKRKGTKRMQNKDTLIASEENNICSREKRLLFLPFSLSASVHV